MSIPNRNPPEHALFCFFKTLFRCWVDEMQGKENITEPLVKALAQRESLIKFQRVAFVEKAIAHQ